MSPLDRPRILAAFAERIRRVMAIGAHFGHDVIILGAWGCGAFGNESRHIAPIFGRIVRDEFDSVFKRVAFAILDNSADRHFIGPFQREFNASE